MIAGENAVSAEVPPRCGACLSAPPPYDWMRASFVYNASSRALAQALARRTGATFAPDWVVRTRNTPPKKAMSQRERLQNVRDAFLVPER